MNHLIMRENVTGIVSLFPKSIVLHHIGFWKADDHKILELSTNETSFGKTQEEFITDVYCARYGSNVRFHYIRHFFRNKTIL